MDMVDEKLIKKHISGDCTPEEIKQVEAWLNNTSVPNETNYAQEFVASKGKIWNEISRDIPQKPIKTIPLYKTLIRYAAAACFAIAFFSAGYFIDKGNTQDKTNMTAQETTNQQSGNLFVYGGNDTHAKLLGNTFDLQFDGQLKLFNGSKSVKTVKVGNATFKLEPMQTYILMGNNQKSSLITSFDFEIEQDFGVLKGDFVIKIITT